MDKIRLLPLGKTVCCETQEGKQMHKYYVTDEILLIVDYIIVLIIPRRTTRKAEKI